MAEKAIKKTDSFFKDAYITKRGKKIGASILDYMMLAIVTVLFFVIVNAVVEALPSMKSKESEIYDVQKEMTSLISESKIATTKDGSLEDSDAISSRYIYRLLRGSFKINSVDENSLSSLIKTYEPINKEDDNAYYYYLTFRKNHNADFNEESESPIDSLDSYVAYLNTQSGFDFEIKDDYPYLPLEVANNIQSYLLDSSFMTGKNQYDGLKNAYVSLLTKGAKDLRTNHKQYVALNEKNNALTTSIYGIRVLEVFISYLIASSFYNLLLPFLLKDSKTLAMKALGLGYTDKENRKPTFAQTSIRMTILFIGHCSIMTIVPFLVYGGSAIDLVYTPFLWNISLLGLGVFSLIYAFLNLGTTFIDKERRFFIEEYFSSLLSKDGKEFHAREEKEASSDELEISRS